MLKNLSKTEKVVTGLLTVTVAYFLFHVVKWIKH